MSAIQSFLSMIPMFVTPFILALFTFISAYVFRFGMSKSGIHFDYILFSIYVIAACVLGGAI